MDSESDAPLKEAASLRQEPIPPPMLESRVVAAMRADGLIRTGSLWSRPARIAASMLIFVAGAMVGHAAPREWFVSPPTATQPKYLLLLAGDVTPAADGSTRAVEYGAWARSLTARGIAVSGEELSSQAEIVATERGVTFPDLTSVGGYFLIAASDDGAAAAVARTCPHIKYGGSIVVRRVQ